MADLGAPARARDIAQDITAGRGEAVERRRIGIGGERGQPATRDGLDLVADLVPVRRALRHAGERERDRDDRAPHEALASGYSRPPSRSAPRPEASS